MGTILINFNVPTPVREQFDAICRVRGRTRTSVLLDLMNSYIFDQSKLLAEQAHRMAALDMALGQCFDVNLNRSEACHNVPCDRPALKIAGNSEFEPFGWLHSDGQDNW